VIYVPPIAQNNYSKELVQNARALLSCISTDDLTEVTCKRVERVGKRTSKGEIAEPSGS